MAHSKWLAVLAVLATSIGAMAGEPQAVPRVIDGWLADLLVAELDRVLSEPGQLTPLPPAIRAVYVSPQHPPCFAFNQSEPYTYEHVAEAFSYHGERFRLLHQKEVVGWGSDGAMVIRVWTGAPGAICDDGRVRPIGQPPKMVLQQAVQANGQWVYKTSIGIMKDDELRPLVPSAELPPQYTLIPDGDRLAVYGLRPPNHSPSGAGAALITAFGDADGWETEWNASWPFGPVSGLVCLEDGGLLAIGSKIVRLAGSPWRGPSEAHQASLARAIESGNTAALGDLLPMISACPTESLCELRQRIQGLPDPLAHMRALQDSVRAALLSAEHLPAEATLSAEREVLSALPPNLERYIAESRALLEACEQAIPVAAQFSPRDLASRLGAGCQLYTDRWIRRPTIVYQADLSQAVIQAELFDAARSKAEIGLFICDAHGRLNLMHREPRSPAGPRVTVSAGRDGELHVLFPTIGLGRWAQGRFEWLDRRPTMRRMTELLGCDRTGRLYLTEASRVTGAHGKQYWVYRPGAEQLADPPVASYATTGAAVIDDQSRVWFVTDTRQASAQQGGDVAHTLAHARPVPLTTPAGTCHADPCPSGAAPTLCRLDPDGTIHRYFSDPVLRDCDLLAGRDGAVFVNSPAGTRLIHDQTVYSAPDIGVLAARHFDDLLTLAPQAAPGRPGARHRPPSQAFSVCAVDDCLWTLCHRGVEAFWQGQPLGIERRLEASGPRRKTQRLLGPINLNGCPAMLIARDSSRLDFGVWAVPRHGDIDLIPAGRPPAETQAGLLTRPEAVHGRPLLDQVNGCVYWHNGHDRAWRISGPRDYTLIPKAGVPALVTGDGRLLVRGIQSTFDGYRLVTPERWADVPVTYAKPLAPVLEEPDGSWLCLTPQGVAWIEPTPDGSFRLARQVRADLPGHPTCLVGRTERALYVMTSNGVLACLPVGADKPPEPDRR